MKKHFCIIAVAALTALSSPAFAGGVPTIDVATVAQLAEQYKKLQEQFTQLQKLEQIASGSRGMGGLLNDPKLSGMLPKEWQDVAATIRASSEYKTERAKLGTATTNGGNQLLDTIAEQNATMKMFFSTANSRLDNVQNLMKQIDLATDPAAKQDLTNRLVNEQNAIAATQQVLAVLKERQQQELAASSVVKSKENLCREFNKASC